MKKALARRPADFVRASFPDERLWDLWSGIERAEARRRTRSAHLRRAGAGTLALSVVVLALVVARPSLFPEAVTELAPARPIASNTEARQISLSEGSMLSLAHETRAHVVTMTPVEVRVRLEHGTIECEVPPVPGRRFVVEAAGFEVVVKGTHFTVSLGTAQALPLAVTVSVERGSVEVREPPEQVLALLGPGQRWASELSAGVPQPPSATPSTTCPTCVAPSPAVIPDPPPAAAAAALAGPRNLFERANTARLAGNTREAAAAFDELRRRYPADARAGQAAFMLGRMRLDTLGDPDGAVDAFSFAIAHPSSGFFLEDAEARLVEALAKAGKDSQCRRARDRFVRLYPESARAALVARQCDAQ